VIPYPYFETPDPISWQDATTYLGSGRVAHPRTFEWNHGVAETIGALLDAGLAVDGIWEHRELEWQGLERMELHDDGLWRLPSGQADLVPLMLSIRAHRP